METSGSASAAAVEATVFLRYFNAMRDHRQAGNVVIPTCADQNSCAHPRCPTDMMPPGWPIRVFQALQQRSTISSQYSKMRLERRCCRTDF